MQVRYGKGWYGKLGDKGTVEGQPPKVKELWKQGLCWA